MADRPPSPSAAAPLRERLIVAATEIAGASGREAVTVERLAARADATPAEVLRLFDGARACLFAAYEDWTTRGLRVLERPLRGTPDVESLLTARLSALVDCLSDRPDVARLCLVELPSAGRAGRTARDATLARYRETLEQQLAALGAAPRTPRAGEMAAGAIYDVLQRAAHENGIERLADVLPELARTWAPAFAQR